MLRHIRLYDFQTRNHSVLSNQTTGTANIHSCGNRRSSYAVWYAYEIFVQINYFYEYLIVNVHIEIGIEMVINVISLY